MKRGDPGINGLDKACKQHDIAYARYKDVENRNKADRVLAEEAWERFKAQDSSFAEKAIALGVMGIMKVKSKLGMGLDVVGMGLNIMKRKIASESSLKRGGMKKQKQNLKKKTKPVTKKGRKKNHKVVKIKKTKKNLTFNDVVRQTKNEMQKSKSRGAEAALKIAKKVVRKSSRKVAQPRVIPLIQGGVLPLLPIIAAMGALGSLAGGASQVAKTLTETAAARRRLEELKRHNLKMEAIAVGGRGLHLKPYKNGYGLFLKNPKNY